MNSENTKEIISIVEEGLNKLADKLQQPAGKLWELALRQNYINAIEDLVYIIFFGMFSLTLYKFVKWGFSIPRGRDSNNFDCHDEAVPIIVFVGIIFGIFLLIVLFDLIPEIINRLVNPEWATLNDIVVLIKPEAK